MYQYKVINPKYSGEAILTYSKQGILARIDVAETNMDAATVAHFKAAVPVLLNDLETGKGFTADTKIIAMDYTVSFNDFWKKYPLKRNAYKVKEQWQRMSSTEQLEAYLNIDLYNLYCRREHSWYKPMIGDRYLRSKEYKTDWNKI